MVENAGACVVGLFVCAQSFKGVSCDARDIGSDGRSY